MLWVSTLETGINSIDEQHKELFRQLDILTDMNNANRFNDTLDFLEKYIIKHFSDEQKLHTSSNYPKARVHRGYHDTYIESFKKLKSTYINNPSNPATMIAITNGVVNWLNKHILVHDMEFSRYYKGLPHR